MVIFARNITKLCLCDANASIDYLFTSWSMCSCIVASLQVCDAIVYFESMVICTVATLQVCDAIAHIHDINNVGTYCCNSSFCNAAASMYTVCFTQTKTHNYSFF